MSRLISETSKLCSNLCFLLGFHFFKLFFQAAGCIIVAAALLRSPPSILPRPLLPSGNFWNLAKSSPLILGQTSTFTNFANSAGLLYFSIFLFHHLTKSKFFIIILFMFCPFLWSECALLGLVVFFYLPGGGCVRIDLF